MHLTKNYTTDGGDTTVIGGRLVVEEGASVEGLPSAAENQAASTATQATALRNDFNALLVKLIPDFSAKWLLEGKTRYPTLAEVNGRKYQLHGNLIRAEKDEEANAIMGISYWMDVTDYDNTRLLYEKSRPVPGVVVIDNLDEMSRNYPERVRNDLRDQVEDLLRHWCEEYHGILRRYDRDRFLVMFEKQDLDAMRALKFPVIQNMHRIENPAGVAASISIGFGEDIIGALNYYGFGDPFNLLAVFAVGSWGVTVYECLFFIRAFLAGLALIAYLGAMGVRGWPAAVSAAEIVS